MGMELIEKITAAIDADERTALEAASASYGFVWRASDSGIYPEDNPSQHPGPFLADAYGHTDPGYGEHIARHDPKRVQQQAQAHREILVSHPHQTVAWGLNNPIIEYACECCDRNEHGGYTFNTTPGCPTILALAKIYGIETGQ